MKLERLHESVLPTVVLIGGLLLAIFAGQVAGTGRTGTAGMIIGIILAVVIFLTLRQRMWILIPATAMLGGKVAVLPLPFTIAQLGVMFALGTILLLKAFKIIRLKPKMGLVDFWLIAVVVYLVTVFLRNPVGVEALGSDRVGGKPYFDVAIACGAYWALARSVATAKDAFFLPLISVAGHALHFALNVIADHFPSTVGPLSRLYSGIAAAELQEAQTATPAGEDDRLGYMVGIGTSSFLAACSYWRPATVINPIFFWRFVVFLVAAYLTLLSGFRTGILSFFISFTLGTYFRRGVMQVVQACVLGGIALGIVILAQGRVLNLPLPAQRALSFLPGNWDYAAKSDAQGSTEWRVEMWKQMLSGNKYISNKWLGDGFGFTRQQLAIMNANMLTGSTADQQENLLISGGVHSGPISTIRFVGYVGLALFLVFLFLIARRAVRLIRRATGTPFYPMSLFFCIPSVLAPLSYVFIYGAYDADLPGVIVTVGMQKLLENSLDAYEESKKEAPAPVQPVAKFRRPPQFAPIARRG